MADKITKGPDGLHVPDEPVLPFIEGDGTGPDIWAAAKRVFDASVDKAYGGQRRINNVTYRTQIRDIALATLVELAGQKHSQYGFANLQKHPQYVFNASTLAFANDADREEAIQTWRESREAARGDE